MTFRAPSTNNEMVDMVISLCRHSSLDAAQLKALHDAVHFAQGKAFGEGVAKAFGDIFKPSVWPTFDRRERHEEPMDDGRDSGALEPWMDAAAPPLIGERVIDYTDPDQQ